MTLISPSRYIVKPHNGELSASSEVSIVVTLLPFHYKEGHKYADKFLLQTCALPESGADPSSSPGRADVWAAVDKEEVCAKKIKSSFVYEGGDGRADEGDAAATAATSSSGNTINWLLTGNLLKCPKFSTDVLTKYYPNCVLNRFNSIPSDSV